MRQTVIGKWFEREMTLARSCYVLLSISLLGLIPLVLSTPTSALVPYQMNFQGRLNDSTGAPMPNGTYNMTFRIYSASTGGTALWSEVHANSSSTGVAVTTGGLFSVQLGSVTSLPNNIWNTSTPLYLEIELPTPATATTNSPSYTEGPMGPRNPIASSPYSFNSQLLNGKSDTDFAAATGSAGYIQNTTTPQVADFNITGSGTVAGNFTTNGQLLVENSSTAALQVQDALGTTVLSVDTNGGYVGIGTDTPGVALDIDNTNGNSDTGILLTRNGLNNYIVLSNSQTDGASAIRWVNDLGGISFQQYLGGSANAFFPDTLSFDKITGNEAFTARAGYIDFRTGGPYDANSKVRILNNGNVGIGNTTPSSLLSVGSSGQFQVDASGNATTSANVQATVINATTGYKVNGVAGLASTTCTSGQVLQNQVVQGGIVTGGTCATMAGGVTGSGTVGTIAMFTASGTIGNSILTQTGTTTLTNSGNLVVQGTGSSTFAGTLSVTGSITSSSTIQGTTITATSGFSGSGANITNINGSNISTGTVSNSRLTGSGSLTITAGTGLTGGGSVALGGSQTLGIDTNYLASNYIQNTSSPQTADFNVTGSGTIGGILNVGMVSASSVSPKLSDWKVQSAPAGTWTNVTYGGGKFVAVGSASPYVMTSPDGVTWTSQSAPAGTWTNVTYGGGKFVAVGSASPYVMTSPDGVTWTSQSAPAGTWTNVIFANGIFVAGGSGANSIMSSSDGTTWVTHSSPISEVDGVAYGAGKFVAVGGYFDPEWGSFVGPYVMTSPDGVTWTSQDMNIYPFSYINVFYGGGKFLLLSDDGNYVSNDGVNWSTSNLPDTWGGVVAYGDGRFVVEDTSSPGGRNMYWSQDGVDWIGQASPPASVSSMTFGDKTIVGLRSTLPYVETSYFTASLSLTGGIQLAGGANIQGSVSVSSGQTINIGGTNSYSVDVYDASFTVSTYAANSRSHSVATGDFNGDGKPDAVAVTEGMPGVASVFMNSGYGTLQTKVDYTVGTNPFFVTAGDLNGDGKSDIVTGNVGQYTNSPGTISVLMNNGNGTFASQSVYSVGMNPNSITIADLNGDGHPDLVVANAFSSTVSILMNNGNGTFASQVTYNTGHYPESVTVADFNGDGKFDIVTANGINANSISILMNNGNGTFASHVDYASSTWPWSVTAADFNGDGKPDVATSNSSGVISVLMNNGNGTFADPIVYATGGSSNAIINTDVNHDGYADLVTANYGTSTISVLVNNRDGTFADAVDYTTGDSTQPYSVSAADFNGDGYTDFVTGNYSSHNISVLLNTLATVNRGSTMSVKNSINTNDALIIQGSIGQTGNLLRLQDASSNLLFSVDSTGNLTVAGTGSFTGTISGADAVGDHDLVTLGQANALYATSTGSANYIQNQTDSAQNASFRLSGTGTIQTDSVSALSVQSASGQQVLNVDTLNGKLTVQGSGQLTFLRTIGGTGEDLTQGVIETSDGNYVVISRSASYGGTGKTNMLLSKVDPRGNIIWSRTLGSSIGDTWGRSVLQTSDGDYVVSGTTGGFTGNVDLIIAKFDGNGNLLWTKVWGGSGDEYNQGMVQASDGGYLVTATTTSYGAGNTDILTTKFDSSGTLQWNKTWGGSNVDEPSSIVATSDGGFAISGYTTSYGSGGYDALIVKYNSSGTVQWSKTWGGSGTDAGNGVIQTSDGSYIISGVTSSYSAGGGLDSVIAKFNSSGTLQWSKTWGGSNDEYGIPIVTTLDGGLVIAGETKSFGSGDYDTYLLKYDSSGKLIWNTTWGGSGPEVPSTLIQASDGGFVETGQTNSFGGGGVDGYLAKFNSVGEMDNCASYCTVPSAVVGSPSASTTSPSGSTSSPAITSTNVSPSVASPSISDVYSVNLSGDNYSFEATGDALFNGSVKVTGGISTGRMSISGDGTIGGNLDVIGNSNFNGSTLVQADSTTAFQVQSASGLQTFNIDTTANGGNLVSNNDFESGITGWTAMGSATLSQYTASSYSGSKALNITTTAAIGDGAKYAMTLLPGTTYTFALYVNNDVSSISTLQIGWNENGTDTVCATGLTSVAGAWSVVYCNFTTGSTIGANPYVFVNQSDAVARHIYVDAVQLRAVGGWAAPYRQSTISLNGVIASPVAIQPTINTNTAFGVYDKNGSSLFTVDAITRRITLSVNKSTLPVRFLVGNGGSDAAIGTMNVGGGDQLVLQDATDRSVFSVHAHGDTTIMTSTNSATAFQIQDASSDTILGVDTISSSVYLGSSTSAASLIFRSGSYTGTIQIAAGGLTNNTVYVLPAVSASIVEICTSAGNCIPNGNNPGDMLYWDGSKWVTIAASSQDSASLHFCGGVPTWSACAPIVNTVSAVTSGEASVDVKGMVVDSAGAAVTDRGVVYSTSPNPTLSSGTVVPNGSGTGAFTTTITGLSYNTYYVRAYATNSVGTVYGAQVSFAIQVYSIGQTGPAGGTVFYDKGSYSDGWRYMEAAPGNWSGSSDPTAQWGCYNTAISGADGTAIGTGKQNTADMLAGCAETGRAANLATSYTGGGKSDWFLPSKDELNQMYLQRSVISGLASTYYWPSSEDSASGAWRENFGNGNQATVNKDFTYSVRPIRYF